MAVRIIITASNAVYLSAHSHYIFQTASKANTVNISKYVLKNLNTVSQI